MEETETGHSLPVEIPTLEDKYREFEKGVDGCDDLEALRNTFMVGASTGISLAYQCMTHPGGDKFARESLIYLLEQARLQLEHIREQQIIKDKQ